MGRARMGQEHSRCQRRCAKPRSDVNGRTDFDRLDGSLNLEWFRTYRAVVEAGSFSKAADTLFITQPAVSQHVRHLEQAFGVPLRVTGPRAFKATEGGEALYRLACRVTDDIVATKESLRRTQLGQQSTIILGSGPTALCHYVPSLLRHFWARNPDIGIQPVTISGAPSITTTLYDGKIDVAIQTKTYIDASLVSVPCIHDQLIPVVSTGHCLAGKSVVSPLDLANNKLAVLPQIAESRQMLDAWFASKSVTVPDVIEMAGFDQIRALAVAGIAVGVISRYSVLQDLRVGRLVELHVEDLDLRRTIYAISRPDSRQEVQKFLAVVAESYQDESFFV